ncbi:MAG: cytochrome c biogenesis protein CcdA [Sciscionella sp.]
MEAPLITLVLIGLVGGLITGISPCVLPVLPVIFVSGGVTAEPPDDGDAPSTVATATRTRSTRPYLVVAGLALSFSIFTLLGTLILSALPLPKDIVRWAGLIVLVLLGLAMMFPKVQHLLEVPFSRMGRRQVRRDRGGFMLGLALGAVYVPCAGPVLTAITIAGATGKIGWNTVALTIAFAVGTAVPLLIFALAGRGVAERVRAFRDRQRGVRIVAGLVVIALAVALTFNVSDALQRAVPNYTASLNTELGASGASRALGPAQPARLLRCAEAPSSTPQNCGPAPAIAGIPHWLNTPNGGPPGHSSLAGKVVLVDFWAYSCINCQRAIPHVQAWYNRYSSAGFVVIGVHTPEYAFEHVPRNVAAGAKRLHITYPIALDNTYRTWNNFGNSSWPAEYLIDATGRVRHVGIGEGDYDTTESLIRALLTSAHPAATLPPRTDVPDATPRNVNQTPETYLGSAHAASIANGRLVAGRQTFHFPLSLPPNHAALAGHWSVTGEDIAATMGSRIRLDFNASRVYLDAGGTGRITATIGGRSKSFAVSGAPDLYPVVSGHHPRHGVVTLSLSPGVRAYSFTFG